MSLWAQGPILSLWALYLRPGPGPWALYLGVWEASIPGTWDVLGAWALSIPALSTSVHKVWNNTYSSNLRCHDMAEWEFGPLSYSWPMNASSNPCL